MPVPTYDMIRSYYQTTNSLKKYYFYLPEEVYEYLPILKKEEGKPMNHILVRAFFEYLNNHGYLK